MQEIGIALLYLVNGLLLLTGLRYRLNASLEYHDRARGVIGDLAVIQGIRNLQAWVDLTTITAIAMMVLTHPVRLHHFSLYLDIMLLMGLVAVHTEFAKQAVLKVNGKIVGKDLVNAARRSLGGSLVICALVFGLNYIPIVNGQEFWAWVVMGLLEGFVLMQMSYSAYRTVIMTGGRARFSWQLGIIKCSLLILGIALTIP